MTALTKVQGGALDQIRREVLAGLSPDPRVREELFAYCTSPFDPAHLPPAPVLPLPDEPQVEDWRRYEAEAEGQPFAFLQARLPQLRIPIADGVSRSDAYGRVMRRGEPFRAEDFGGVFGLHRPDLFGFTIHGHPAGSLPVLLTSERHDFEALCRALAYRSEPVPIEPAVNAQMVAGAINWDRVTRYRQSWACGRSPDEADAGWPMELQRVAQADPEAIRDRFIIIQKNPYSAVTGPDLDLDLTPEQWLDASTTLRIEHEFTHYATKRLFGQMRVNLLDEAIADFMGITAALGTFRSRWFLAFLGLERWPDVRPGGRVQAYRGRLDAAGFPMVCALTVAAAGGLEQIGETFYRPAERARMLLALSTMTLEILASAQCTAVFAEAYARAGRLMEASAPAAAVAVAAGQMS